MRRRTKNSIIAVLFAVLLVVMNFSELEFSTFAENKSVEDVLSELDARMDTSDNEIEPEKEPMLAEETDSDPVQTGDEYYTIVYTLEGGVNDPRTPEKIAKDDESLVVLYPPTREGWVFDGWYVDRYDPTSTLWMEHEAGHAIWNTDIIWSDFYSGGKYADYVSSGENPDDVYDYMRHNSLIPAKVETSFRHNVYNDTIYLIPKWLPKNYTVYYDGNGAVKNGETVVKKNYEYGSGNPIADNVFSRNGYRLTNWKYGTELLALNYDLDDLIDRDRSGSYTVSAVWSTCSYSIRYEENGGDVNWENPRSYTVENEYTLGPIERYGYTFGGWYSDPAMTQKVTKIAKGTTGDKVLYAKWIPNTYTIVYNKNGATGGSMADTTGCTFDVSYKLRSNAYTRKGYTFTGWNTKADGSGTSYKDQASVKNLSSQSNDKITLYAQWEITKYQITYKLNGGTNHSGNPAAYTVDQAVALSAPSRTGYTFSGWYSDQNYKNKVTSIQKGSTGNKTYYAKWTPNTYTIVYNKNGATGGSMTDTANCAYGKSYTLKKNTYSRMNYTFTGWNTKADGSGKSYKNSASVSNLSSKNGAKITLYAQWEVTKYQITYKLNGGTNHAKNPSTYTYKQAVTLSAPSRTGYTFGGWYSDQNYKNKATGIKKGSSGNKTYYAKWTPNKYTIVYNKNGATSGSMTNTTGCTYGKSYTLKKNAYSRTGYTFTGWNTKADGSGKTYMNSASVSNLISKNGGKVTLYAQWKLTEYKITYNLNGGTNHAKNPATYNMSQAVTLNNPTRTGYTFDGWYTDKSFKNKVGTIAKGSQGAKVFYAKWTVNKYTIAYNGNGATGGSMASTSCTYGKNVTLRKNTFTRKGYTFVGWATKADGSGTEYADGAVVKNLTGSKNGTCTLYAKWRSNTYHISYVMNGGTNNANNPSTYTSDSSVTLQNPTKEYSVFLGWYKDAAFTKSITTIPVGTAGDLTLYAKWRDKVRVACTSCKGTGRVACSHCGGKGTTRCTLCYGSGKRMNYYTKKYEKCTSCYGSGYKDCIYCVKGKDYCYKCGGIGYRWE